MTRLRVPILLLTITMTAVTFAPSTGPAMAAESSAAPRPVVLHPSREAPADQHGAVQATTQVAYITYNMAGGAANYGQHGEGFRILTANHMLAYVDYASPMAVAVQELCISTVYGRDDAGNFLEREMAARGYFPYQSSTLASLGTCLQRNAVYAKGIVQGGEMFVLPYDGNQTRVMVCVKMTAFVPTTNCSTHFSHISAPARQSQSQEALNDLRVYGANRYSWAGGDFNAPFHTERAPSFIWDEFFSEGDQWRNPPRTTHINGKIDYQWGIDPNVVAISGAAFDGRNEFSDHNVFVAPYLWYS